MNRPTQSRRALTVLMSVLTVAGAACGGSGEAAEGGPVDQAAVETTTTAVPPLADDGPVELTDSINTLIPGVTYLTNTDVPFSFSVVESEAEWWPVAPSDWSVTLVFGNMIGGSVDGPQLSLGVAEIGATRESVVTAMTASAAQIDYQESEGLFGGRDSIILDGKIEGQVIPGPVRILTGEDSWIEVIRIPRRSYRSHVFEEDGRVFIVSVEADTELSLVLAEAAPIFESLQIGDAA